MTDSYLVLDLETTGFSPRQDRIIEVGYIQVIDGVALAPVSYLVNPERTLDPRITELTGIRQKDVDDARPIAYALGNLVAALGEVVQAVLVDDVLLERPVVVGHNVGSFDLEFLAWEAWRTGLPFWPKEEMIIHDTATYFLANKMSMRRFTDESESDFARRVRSRRPRWMRFNLHLACLEMGITHDVRLHRAGVDAAMCYRLYEALRPAMTLVERPRVGAARL